MSHVTMKELLEAGVHFGTHFVGAPSARKVVYARDVAPVLAYEVVMKGIKADQTETEMHYFVDANTGRILDKWDDVQTAKPGPGGGTSCTGATAATGTGTTAQTLYNPLPKCDKCCNGN